MVDSWCKTGSTYKCWVEEKILFFVRLKLCVVAHITLHPLVHISKYEIYFFEIFEEEKKLEKEGCLACAHRSVASLHDLESPSPYQMLLD